MKSAHDDECMELLSWACCKDRGAEEGRIGEPVFISSADDLTTK